MKFAKFLCRPTYWLANFTGLVLAIVISSGVSAGPITHYRMDTIMPPHLIGGFFTFSVNDINSDGFGSSNEIFNFSGISCALCGFNGYGDPTTLGMVQNDVLFGGSGESFFNLSTFNWVHLLIGATNFPDTEPEFRLLTADFSWSDAEGNGSPMRLYHPLNGAPLWTATQVPEPGSLALLVLGLGGLMWQRRATS